MKHLILIAVIALSLSNAIAQVPWNSKQISTSYLMDIVFVNNNTGFTVGGGNNQTIYITSNGGQNWILTNTSQSFNSAAYNSTGSWFAAGSVLAKSSNNGLNWTVVLSGSPYGTIYRIVFTSPDTVYILSDNGNVSKSTNSGINWNTYIGVATVPNDMCFINSMTGFINENNGQPRKTTNGGLNWFTLNTGLPNLGGSLLFINETTGFILTLGAIFKTTNGGTNWNSTLLPGMESARKIYFKNNMTGYACGNVSYKTTNTGSNWILMNTGGIFTVTSVSFPSNDTGYASTLSGHILKTITGGVSSLQLLSELIPEEYSLEQNYPNPFNATTKIRFKLKNIGSVALKIYDILGKEIRTLVNEMLHTGTYEVYFDAVDLPSGIYFYQLKADKFTETKKLILLK